MFPVLPLRPHGVTIANAAQHLGGRVGIAAKIGWQFPADLIASVALTTAPLVQNAAEITLRR